MAAITNTHTPHILQDQGILTSWASIELNYFNLWTFDFSKSLWFMVAIPNIIYVVHPSESLSRILCLASVLRIEGSGVTAPHHQERVVDSSPVYGRDSMPCPRVAMRRDCVHRSFYLGNIVQWEVRRNWPHCPMAVQTVGIRYEHFSCPGEDVSGCRWGFETAKLVCGHIWRGKWIHRAKGRGFDERARPRKQQSARPQALWPEHLSLIDIKC